MIRIYIVFHKFNIFFKLNSFFLFIILTNKNQRWGLGIGDWGLGIGPNPQSPIPNSQSPIPNPHVLCEFFISLNFK